MCRVGEWWQWIPRAAAAVESSLFLEMCRLAKQTMCQSEISWCDSSTPSSNWAPFLFPRTHPIWTWRAPVAWWQLTIASSSLINCWNDTPSHKQCIILPASETLQSAIVGAKYASTFSLRLSLKAGWERSGLLGVLGMEGGGCVWHVNSNQGSDIHQADSQDQFGEGGLASTFLCFCFHLSLTFSHSHFSLCSLSRSSCFFAIHLFTSYPSITRSLFHLLSGCIYPLCFSFFLCVIKL